MARGSEHFLFALQHLQLGHRQQQRHGLRPSFLLYEVQTGREPEAGEHVRRSGVSGHEDQEGVEGNVWSTSPASALTLLQRRHQVIIREFYR